VPREQARVPAFAAPQWRLVDQGVYTFRYRFYARAGQAKVSGVVVEGERSPATEGKTIWEDGDEVMIFLSGPLAEKDRLPLCVRSRVEGFDLEGLYRVLKPKLQR
jgi:hypothetical protein